MYLMVLFLSPAMALASLVSLASFASRPRIVAVPLTHAERISGGWACQDPCEERLRTLARFSAGATGSMDSKGSTALGCVAYVDVCNTVTAMSLVERVGGGVLWWDICASPDSMQSGAKLTRLLATKKDRVRLGVSVHPRWRLEAVL